MTSSEFNSGSVYCDTRDEDTMNIKYSERCDDEYQNLLKITEHTKMKTIKQEMRYDHDS